jgi:zinc protease
MTPDSANAIARRTLAPASVVWVVVGDMGKVERGIRELQLGEVRRIDADGNPLP